MLFRGIADAREAPLHLPLELLDDARLGHARGQRRADHGDLLGAVELLEQCEQALHALAAGGGEGVVGILGRVH